MHTAVRYPRSHRPGFLLVEVLLGMVLFGMFLTSVSSVVLRGQESSVMAGDRVRGLYATLRGVEAARSIRDGSFASLTVGNHGVAIGPAGKWSFSGTQTTISGSYTTQLAVTSLGTGWSQVLATTGWKHGRFQSGSVILRTELTNWTATGSVGDWTSAVLERAVTFSGSPLLNNLAVAGNTVFITGDTSSGGAGLYMVDLSSGTASASQIGSSFTLGATAYDVAAKGAALYLATGSSTQEIRVYDIASPSTPTLKTSWNLSGSSLATSLKLAGPKLYVGASADATYKEFYAFNVTNTGAVVPLGSLEIGAGVQDIALYGTGAWLAMNDGAGEMRIVDVDTATGLTLAPGGSYNFTSTEIGRSIALSGTSALLGRQKGTGIQEMILTDAASDDGPWYHEGSGSLLGIAADPLSCYAYLVADSSGKAFQIVNLRDLTSLPELWSANSTNGPGRNVLYDPVRDRVFVLTRSALLIYRPTATSGLCT